MTDAFVFKIAAGGLLFFLTGGIAGFLLAMRILPREEDAPWRIALDLEDEDAVFRMQEAELEKNIGRKLNRDLNRATGINQQIRGAKWQKH